MSKKDREHFKQYRDQTRVKHEILKKYILAFFHVLKGRRKNLVYIDGFAGRGTYDNLGDSTREDGSPLHALKVISEKPDLSEKVTSVFIEADRENYKSLVAEIDKFYGSNGHIRKPEHYHGNFSDSVGEILDEIEKEGLQLAPSFVFVDPCGIDGASIKAIERILRNDRCEAFIFFNIDGVRRVCGLENVSGTIVELYGNHERAQNLLDKVKLCSSPAEREEVMLSEYICAIREEVGAGTYVTLFPIEHEKKKITSHYLIHVTKHGLGFKIMKDVMWKMGSTEGGKGGLGLIQASKYQGGSLFRPDWDSFKLSILHGLNDGLVKVGTFYHDWVMRPEDKFSEPAYREALLELEAEEEISIIDKNGTDPKPAAKRRMRLGKVTLGEDYYVLRKSSN